MVLKTQRKVVEVGNKKYRSTTVTLPLDWIRFNQLNKVDIFYDSLIVIVHASTLKLLDDFAQKNSFIQSVETNKSYEMNKK